MNWNNIKVICVDFFDTVCFRHIHSFQLIDQWAECMNKRFPELKDYDITEIRKSVEVDLLKENSELAYKEMCSKIFQKTNLHIQFDEFYEVSIALETYIDLATQYPNKKLIKWLRNMKQQGKKIVLVSDFYLGKERYEYFFQYLDIADIFDDIFISADYNATKRNGKLYKVVCQSLKATDETLCPENIVMIGDSKWSDVKKAKEYGLKAIHYFPILHKLKTNCSKITRRDYCKLVFKRLEKYNRKSSCFGEYGLILYYFIVNLRSELVKQKCKKATFLSRGGYLLCELFDEYSYYIDSSLRIEGKYCYTSRKALHYTDEESMELLRKYLNQFCIDEKLYMVDEGWNCSSQKRISELLNIKTYGYYIGTFRKPDLDMCLAQGILFDKDEERESEYYGVLRTNCLLYEELLRGNHGSCVGYVEEDNKVQPVLDNNKLEERLYDEVLGNVQKRIKMVFLGLCVWNSSEIKIEKIAITNLKSILFNNYRKLDVMKKMYESHIEDFMCENGKQDNRGEEKSFKPNYIKMFFEPQSYCRYMCRLQLVMWEKKIPMPIYYICAIVFYGMVRCSMVLEKVKKSIL